MYFKQFYLGCLAHASYLIGSRDIAAVVDPQRDVDGYIEEAARQDLKIRYVIETHLHADFVSGHRELAARTGAEIVFGRLAAVTFPYHPVNDGESLQLGDVTLKFLETPGHTPEGISILVIPEGAAGPTKVLTGDTLFIGDVGRPDLAGAKGYTPQQMASMLYDSLHEKLLKLRDDVEVYPAHGAGSMCGRHISKETSSTIGEQRRTNYALKEMSRQEFVDLMTTDLPEVPAYFSMDAQINREGAGALEELPPPAALSPDDVDREKARAVVLDVRDAPEFASGHIPGSINIGLNGQFASWVGNIIQPSDRVVIVAEDVSNVREAAMRMARVGLENIIGYLDGGIAEWNKAGFPTSSIQMMPVEELHARIGEGWKDLQIVDVRRPAEFEPGHIPGAQNSPLTELARHTPDALAPQRPVVAVCAGGYRSMAAASILQNRGFQEIYNVVGGTAAWINGGFPVQRN
jgi:hydroxyacylglutathione hydrolase